MNWAQAASLRQRSPHPRSPSPKERGAVRSSAVWGCKENFELGTSCKLAPAGVSTDYLKTYNEYKPVQSAYRGGVT